jgi:hypothetical protein
VQKGMSALPPKADINSPGPGSGGLLLPGGLDGGVVGGSDGGFLFGIFFCAVGRAPKFWKYVLQVVDSFMR